MIEWLIVPENGALLTWIGFGLGVVGAIIGFVGLYIALRQLAAIKSEAEASTAAIRQVQLKVASFDTIQECNVAKALIGDIKKHLSVSEWREVLRSYELLIESFLRLAHSNSDIEDEDRQVLNKSTKDMAKFCGGIRKKFMQGDEVPSLRGQDIALRDFSEIMTKVTFAVMKDLQK